MKKRYMSLFAALLLACFLLISCGGNIAPPAETPDSSETTEELSGPVSETEDLSDEVSELPEESPEPPSEPEELDPETLFLLTARSLLQKDASFIQLLIYGRIFDGEDENADKFALRTLDPSHKLSLSAALRSELESVYTESAIGEILSYPEYGTRFVVLSGTQAEFSNHFAPAPLPGAAISNAALKYLADDSAAVEVPDETGGMNEMSFTLTPDGWRLDRSYFFAVHSSLCAPEYPTSGVGSAAALSGKCLVINLFINDGESSWNEKAMSDVISKVGAAARFIKDFTLQYGSQVEFEISDLSGSPRLTTAEKLPDSPEGFVRFDLLFGSTVFGSLHNYVAEYFDLDSYDNYCVLIHINKQGMSYALPCDTDAFDWRAYVCERAVLYRSEDRNYEYYCSESTYAHEILHLFGAADLYGEYIDERDALALAHYYPNDIMAVNRDIKLAGVSPLTAYLTGMTDALHEQFVFVLNK